MLFICHELSALSFLHTKAGMPIMTSNLDLAQILRKQAACHHKKLASDVIHEAVTETRLEMKARRPCSPSFLLNFR